jgi:type I restriction enzyme S subunit
MIADLKAYPSYKKLDFNWLGELPQHWQLVPVRRFSRVFAGATPSRGVPAYWNNGDIPWLASGDVNLRNIRTARQFITNEGFKNSSTKWIRPGSLVVALAGQGRTKGMVATVDFSATCNQSMAVIQPESEVIDHHYLAYWLESRYLDIRALVGDGLRDGLNLDHVKSIRSPVPPRDEQEAIVRYLNSVTGRLERTIKAKRQVIALLNEQKQAIISRAVTCGLDQSVALKPSGVPWLGDIPSHWAVRALKSACVSKALYGANIPAERYVQSGVRFLRTTDITEAGGLRGSGVQVASQDAAGYLLGDGDFLVSRSGTVGRAFVYQGNHHEPCAYAGYLVRFVLRREVLLPDFVFAFTKTFAFSSFLRSVVIASTIDNVNGEKYGNMPIVIPPLGEQQMILTQIATQTEPLAASISNLQSEIELLHEYRIRLVADVVTGKLDVRAVAARLPDDVPLGTVGDDTDLAEDLDVADEEASA